MDRPSTARRVKWDRRFLALAAHVATWSKDPSTQCGAVIVDPRKRVVSIGYNGFAEGVRDTPERLHDRETKYKLVVHAERNAILFAGRDLTGCTLYTHPFGTCAVCAAMVIQAGIKRVVAPFSDNPRWTPDFALAGQQYAEAGVTWDVYREGDEYPASGWVVYPLLSPPENPAFTLACIPGHGKSEL